MKDKKIIIAIIAFAVVLLLTVGATYAYFTATATSSGTQQTLNMKTANLGITYTHGNKINFNGTDNLVDEWYGLVLLSVTNNGSVTQSFDVMWDTITTNTIVGYANLTSQTACIQGSANCTDVRDDFNTNVYEYTGTINTIDDLDNLTEVSSLSIVERPLYNVANGNLIVSDIVINPGETKKLAVILSFNYLGDKTNNSGRVVSASGVTPVVYNNNQDYQQGKQFTGTIKVGNVKLFEAVLGSVSDWNYTDSENGTILTSFKGDLSNSQNVVATQNYWTDLNMSFKYKTAASLANAAALGANNIAYDITIPNVIVDEGVKHYVKILDSSLLQGGTDDTINNDNYARIKSVKISEGIALVGGSLLSGGAFMGDLSNTSVNLPSSLISIGEMSFLYNNVTGNIVIPNDVEEIKGYAFASNPNLTSITFGNTLQSIEFMAFGVCNLSGVVDIPLNVTSIGDSAFKGNANMTTINFVGRSSLDGLVLDNDWNLKDDLENPDVYYAVTCNGNVCN